MRIIHITRDQISAFRVNLNILADIFQQRAATDQKKLVAIYHLEYVRAEDYPPTENSQHREHIAENHHPDGNSQIAVQIANKTLQQKSAADDQTELLQQGNPGPDEDVGVEILKIKPDQNGDDHHGDAHPAAFLKKKDAGIDCQECVGCHRERSGQQNDLGDQERKRPDWDIYSE